MGSGGTGLRGTLVALALSIGALGCGDDDGSGGREIVPPPEPEPAEARWEIHEWGLVDVVIAGGTVEIAAGPGEAPTTPTAEAPEGEGDDAVAAPDRPTRPGPSSMESGTGSMRARPRKPVLYVQLLDETESVGFELTAALPEGRLAEHWPPGESGGSSVTWQVRAERGSCAGSAYPTESDARCTDVSDGYCEAAELEAYETDDGACLTVDGERFDHLFYRGLTEGLELPLRVEWGEDGTVVVHNERAQGIPGELVRVLREEGATRIARARIPAVGESVEVERPSREGAVEAVEGLGNTLRRQGLTDAEVGAFARAWNSELFGGAEAPQARVPDALLYWIPAWAAPDVAELRIEPEPTEVRRGLLVRIDLAPREGEADGT